MSEREKADNLSHALPYLGEATSQELLQGTSGW